MHSRAALPGLCGVLLFTLMFLMSCGRGKQAKVSVPPPPETTNVPSSPAENNPTAKENGPPPGESADIPELKLPADARPIATETGLASWYGPPYHNRRGSNGEVYNMHAMTAAHRTFPLESIVRVTNVKTGSSALVRITDRGPFIPGRILDLSLAAAQKLDVWKPGVAEVRVELMQAPASVDSGGKWAVQIGGIHDEHTAAKLADHLTRRYRTAQVLKFKSPAGDWWIRIRVQNDDHERAEKLMAETETPQGAVFLVRLD